MPVEGSTVEEYPVGSDHGASVGPRTLMTVAAATVALTAAVPAQSGEGPLPFAYDLYTFRGGEGSATRVVASVAVRAGALHRRVEDGSAIYRFDLSFVVSDPVRPNLVRTDDSVFVSVPRSLASAHLIHSFVELEAPPSRMTRQQVIMTDASIPGVGQMYQSAFPVPDYTGDTLMLSDVALGVPDLTGGWGRPGVPLALLPTSEFPGGAFDLYYEIYNLPGDRPYTTEVAITGEGGRRAGDDSTRAPVVRASFEERSPGQEQTTIGALRRVTSTLAPGAYRLTVTVQDEGTGNVVARTRDFTVTGDRTGTTLVPALPRRARTGSQR